MIVAKRASILNCFGRENMVYRRTDWHAKVTSPLSFHFVYFVQRNHANLLRKIAVYSCFMFFFSGKYLPVTTQ
jgi:hypothetical protein